MRKEEIADIDRGPVAWMAGNSVIANLLMAVFLIGGLVVALQMKQEVFPDFTMDQVNISISYPGASPEEIETGIIQAVEEAIEGLEGIDEVTATAREGNASITVEAIEGADVARLWQEIKSEVDRIDTFPDEAKDPEISIASHKRGVMTLALYGNAEELTLRSAADQVRDELLLDPHITQVELTGVKNYEVHVEIPQATLRRYGITLEDAANAIAKASVELGGGSLKTSGGDILVRVKDRRYYARQYAQLPLLTKADGSRILLGDVATVWDGFEVSNTWASFNGEPAVMIEIYRVGDQTPTEVADAARLLLEQMNHTLSKGLELTVLEDNSEVFSQRAELLLKNAYMGLGLVFIFLALFLEIRLAFWVSLGIPISFMGSFIFLSAMDFSINMISMFAFIVTLGIVVDDAVHFLSKYQRARKEGQSAEQAVRYAFHTVGRALWITTVVLVAGFSVLALSGFRLNADMGLLSAIVIFIALVVDFILLPILLMIFDKENHYVSDAKKQTPETPTTSANQTQPNLAAQLSTSTK